MITKISEIEDVRKRRSDPKFRDLQRYITDMKYVLKILTEQCKVLDIGAGAGVFSIALAHLGFDVTATNLTIEAESEINFFETYGCKFASLNLDNEKLPFPNGEFDAVLCLHVVEHLKKPHKALMEIQRVLRPKGTLILMTPNGAITSIYKNLLFWKSVHNNTHVREYPLNELVSMLKISGFKICDVDYSTMMVSENLLDISLVIWKLLVYTYCFFCTLFPTMSYEIHITAQAKNYNAEGNAKVI